jgi:outer membrane usher protein
VERQARPFSFGFQTQLASARFAQLGFAPDRPPPRQVSVARASYAAAGIGSFYVTHVRQHGRSEPAAEFVSAGYSTALPGNIYLSFFALQSLTGDRARSVGLYLTRSLGSRTTASASWNRQKNDNEPGIQLQQSLPHGPGMGYRVAASGGARPREEAALFLRGDVGTYGLEAARVDGTSGQRLTASGGVALLGGRIHLARRLDESFAVVRVGEYPAVPVYVDNQLVAHTDGGGAALVPSLRPYQKNSISIDQNGLPLDARVGTLRMPVSLPRRSGRVVTFPVRATRGALLRITLESGAPLPSGAVVRLAGQAEEFPVALRGEAYVTGLARDNELEASWKGRSCRIRVAVPPDAGPLPVLGPFVCRGVTP